MTIVDPGGSTAAKRVVAAKKRTQTKIQKPTAISDVLGPTGSNYQSQTPNPVSLISPTGKPEQPAYGGQYGSTAAMDALARQQGQVPQNDDLAALQALLAAQMQGGGGSSSADLSKIVSNSVNGEYDPQIAALQQAMKQAKTRAGGAKKDLGALYNDLSGFYTGRVEPTKNMYKIAKQDAKDRTESLKSSITQDYASRLKEQVDMYKQLGIEAAAPSATEGQYADEASQLAVSDNTGSAEEAALAQEQTGDVNYWSQGAGIAKHEGVEQQADVMQQLQDYLNTQGTNLASLQGQKKAAYNSSLLKAKQEQADAANQQQNQIWQRMLELAKLKQSMQGSAGSTPSKGLTGVAAYLGDQRLANEFQTSLGEAATWSNSAQAKSYYGGQSPNSPEEMAQVIRDNAANRGLSPEDQLKLWQAALVYYNKYK